MRTGTLFRSYRRRRCNLFVSSGFKVKDDLNEGRSPVVKALFLIIILLVSCHAVFAQAEQPATTHGIEEVYLAKDDGNGKAGEQVTEFRTTDIPIYCVVLLESDAKTVVRMNFVAVNVAGVKPETKVVTASYTTKNGKNRVNFTGQPDGKWTPGKYRVDLFLDGKKAGNIEFMIKNSNAETSAIKFFQPPETPKPKIPRWIKN